MDLAPPKATVVRDGKELEIATAEVALAFQLATEAQGWLHDFGNGLEPMTVALRNVLNTQLTGQINVSQLWTRVTVPSITVESYSRALRIEVEERDRIESSEAPLFDDDLDARLYRLDPAFPGLRAGSWQALSGDNPDRWRHAASSHRELIRMVLARLAPDAEAIQDEPGSKMRIRVQAVLGSESSAEYAVSVARAVVSLYTFLNKPCHTLYRHESLKGALLTGDGPTPIYAFALGLMARYVTL